LLSQQLERYAIADAGGGQHIALGGD